MKEHLKGLDSLRAFAALIVVWGHIEQLKQINGLPSLLNISHLPFPNPHLSVILFFVISGFLITYLLVKEKDKNGSFSLKRFYIRRTLRILPLYYLVLLLTYFIFRVDYKWQTITLCFSIFPNIAHAINLGWPTSIQLWSIGVEEQFYLFWPLLLRIIPEKKVSIALLMFFVFYTILPDLIPLVFNQQEFDNESITMINKFFYGTKFNSLAIGSLFGILFARQSTTLNFLKNGYLAFSLLIITASLWFSGYEFPRYSFDIFSILFATIVYSVVASPAIKLDNKITSFLGRISYGIYMFHWMVILLLIEYIPVNQNIISFNLWFYLSTFGITILLAWLSFSTFEKFFLNLKKRFQNY